MQQITTEPTGYMFAILDHVFIHHQQWRQVINHAGIRSRKIYIGPWGRGGSGKNSVLLDFFFDWGYYFNVH